MFHICYQQLHLKYLCNLTRYGLQAPWGWNNSVETCRSVIVCEIIVHLLVIIQNNKRCTVHVLKLYKKNLCFNFSKHLSSNFKLFLPRIFSTYGMKTNWCHYFIRILLDLYMFRAHRPIFRWVRTAVHTTIGSVSVPLCSRAVCCGLSWWLFSTPNHQDRRVRTAVHTTIVSVSVRSGRVLCVLWPVLVTCW